MKAQRILGIVLVLVLLGTSSMAGFTCAAAPTPPVPIPANTMAGAQSGQTIIIDHTCTDLSRIPDYWLEQAKKLALHYAHTSHGSQVISGIEVLEQRYPQYDYSIFYAGSDPPSSLNCKPGTLCIYDGNPPETYITPEGYWSTEDGKNRTRAVANTGLFDFSMWSWCGQQSDNSAATTQEYLSTLNTFEQEYPAMRFIYMTGHLDGSGVNGNLHARNNQVRDYVQANNKVLFDFADIESYDPDGNYYLDRGANDNCDYDSNGDGDTDRNWAQDWCNAHPGDPLCDPMGDCAHSQPLNCNLKATAFWWMMARLAGWDGTAIGGSRKTPSVITPTYGQTVTYTVVVGGLSVPLTATVYLTDVVPAGLAYVSGTLTATQGTVNAALAPTLRWTGTLSPTGVVTVTYAVTVTALVSQAITNTALIAAPGTETLTRTATVIANGYTVHLPLVMKDHL